MKQMRQLLVLALVWTVAGCQTPAPGHRVAHSGGKVAAPLRLTLVGTNDLHGWLEPKITRLPSGQTFEFGGAAILGGYVANLRAANPDGVLLLDAGDLFQGTLVSNVTEGKAVIDVYNQLGYTASAIGNHEFDYGPEGAKVMATSPGDDAFGALAARIREAKFPFLSANIVYAATGKRPEWLGNEGLLLVEVKGVKVGIVGLTTPQTPYTTNPANVAALRFGALAPTALQGAHALRAAGADVVVAVLHAGGKCAKVTSATDLSTCDLEHGEVFQMLKGLPQGTLDAVIAGHIHTRLGCYVAGVPVISTSGMGKAFGVIDLFVAPQSHKVLHSEIQAQIPLCLHADPKVGCDPQDLKDHPEAVADAVSFVGRRVEADPEIAGVLAPHLARVKESQERSLGVVVPQPLVRNYEAESALGDVLVDALREGEKADIALMNSGGLRADLPAGGLTYGRIYEVMPFDNTVATMTLTGEELQRFLEAGYSARKGVYQVAGLRITLARCPGPGRLKSVLLEDGRPLQPHARYRVVLPDFLARGGDGLMSVVSSLPEGQIDLGLQRAFNFRDTLVDYFQRRKRPLIAPIPSRISFVDDGQRCGAVGAAPVASQRSAPPGP